MKYTCGNDVRIGDFAEVVDWEDDFIVKVSYIFKDHIRIDTSGGSIKKHPSNMVLVSRVEERDLAKAHRALLDAKRKKGFYSSDYEYEIDNLTMQIQNLLKTIGGDKL